MKRRNILLALLIAVLNLTAAAAAPKYIFFFIGDGMGIGAVSLAQVFKRTVEGDTIPLTMLQFPTTSLAFTHSASSPVTDSAAAGTALATGNKTNNGMLGVTPDSIAVESIATRLHNMGYAVGLVTTVAPDDATPGAFYAHQPSRSMFYEIGCDAAASGFEFLGGANLRGLKTHDGTPTDLLEVLESAGVEVVHGLKGLETVTKKRVMLLGTNIPSDNEIGLAIDSIEGAMTLPDMTRACLSHLLKDDSKKGFFMMVEGGSIDHGGHANDAPTNLRETLAFDKSLAIAYEFYKSHPDETLIVVTADHETGGLVLAFRAVHYDLNLDYLKYTRMSKDSFNTFCKSLLASRTATFDWNAMRDVLSDKFGLFTRIPVTEKEEAKLRESFDSTFQKREASDEEGMYNTFKVFASNVFKLISAKSGIGWTTGDHSGTPVPVFSVGVDSHRFGHILDNTDIPKIIMSIATEK